MHFSYTFINVYSLFPLIINFIVILPPDTYLIYSNEIRVIKTGRQNLKSLFSHVVVDKTCSNFQQKIYVEMIFIKWYEVMIFWEILKILAKNAKNVK